MAWVGVIKGGTPRVNHAGVLINTQFYVFGGYARSEQADFNDSVAIVGHTFDLRSHVWSSIRLAAGSVSPSMRYGHSVVHYKGSIYLWGGRNDVDVCNRLYRFDTKLSKWFFEGTTGTPPPPRDGHSACLIGSQMYIFGGFDAYPIDQFGLGLYMVDLDTKHWTAIKTIGNEPYCRDFHGAVAIGPKMYVFGGRSTRRPPHHDSRCIWYPNLMDIYDSDTNKWTTPPAAESDRVPIGRRSHCFFAYESNIYLFGGYNCVTSKHYNDLWIFNVKHDKWTKATTWGKLPSPRRRMACFLYNSHAYFYGGTEPNNQPRMQIDDTSDDNLSELGDIQVLELKPTLVTLCMLTVKKYNIDYDGIPSVLASALQNMVA